MRIACMELHRGIFEPEFSQDFKVSIGQDFAKSDFEARELVLIYLSNLQKTHQKMDKIYFQKR